MTTTTSATLPDGIKVLDTGRQATPFDVTNQFEEMTKKNMAIFEQTMSMFNPFTSAFNDDGDKK